MSEANLIKLVHYAVTIKYVKTDKIVYREDFISLIYDIMSSQGIYIQDYLFEMDKQHKLHIHGILLANSCLVYRELKRTGWQIFIRKMYNLKRWTDYKEKTLKQEPQEQLLLRHWYIHNYGFIDFPEITTSFNSGRGVRGSHSYRAPNPSTGTKV